MFVEQDVGRVFSVHNGKAYQEVFVDEYKIGRKAGEFSITKKLGGIIHREKKKKKNKK